MHIPDDPLYYEKFLFHARRSWIQSLADPLRQIGVLICWDQWYPEAARLTALQGAQILFYPTAIGWYPGEKRNTANASTIRGKPSSAAMPSPTAANVAVANRIRATKNSRAEASILGPEFVAGTSGENPSPKPARPKRKF